ncbi:hypothetical protein IT072_06775 [Leifsonia sp. ZF2019]|uniref:hypothetical protein n=1 Tax=Leifsonia sp. ZF2019 TaxID=2781978 RepID=UPI001CBCDFE4|nr:hypothetical protein [Leifsonia sp. ZF2019]UAJ80710.1 hypothetical protein IT072_06775 [Leifsonia sp. ZF2019]
MMKKTVRGLAASLGGAALVASLLTGGAATAAEPDSGAPYGAVIADPAGLSGPLYLAGEDGSATLVGSDGTIGAAGRTSRAGCSWTNMAVPAGGAWYTSVDGCSLIGATATATHAYKYQVDANSKGNPCVQGRGYKKVGTSWSANYEAIGCGKSGSKNITIGNVITVSKVKAQSIGATGTALVFQ